MKLRLLTPLLTAVALSILALPRAVAIPLHYEISGGSVSAQSSDPGLVVGTSIASGLSGTSFMLDDGASSGWFNYFNIWTNETNVNADDTASKLITATLTFNDPVANASVSGVTFGGRILFGLAQYGQVSWDGPATIALGDRTFSVALSNESFNFGILGLYGGYRHGAKVKADITQISSKPLTPEPPVKVPDGGSTLVLLGIGVMAFGLLSRRFVVSA